MNIKEIEKLLEKYYEGETTLAEERLLKDFFLSGNVPMELSVHKSQFIYFKEASGDEITDLELDEKVFDKTVNIPVFPLLSGRNRFYYITGIAATVLLLIGLVFTFNEDVFNRKQVKVSTADKELMFTETQDILAFVSVKFNRGIDKMEYIGKLDQAMQKMQMLSKYYQYQSIIINPDQFENRSAKTK
jgi:hypothetical protein